MANFDPNAYETVDSRIKRFYTDHPLGRITTELVAMEGEPARTRWVVKASVWRGDRADLLVDADAQLGAQVRSLDLAPDGTGYAFEIDGTGMANRTSALENCETSAIGRALANIGYSGDKRASREEMVKTQARAAAPAAPSVEVVEQHRQAMLDATSLAGLQEAWTAAGKAGVAGVPELIKTKDEMKAALA